MCYFSKKKAVKKGRALVGYVTQAFKDGQLMSSFQQVKSANKAMAQVGHVTQWVHTRHQ